MTLGEKIKKARLEKGLTQSEVSEDKITRNMLSAIESNKSIPSIDTLLHISDRLELPIAYFLSDDFDISVYRKKQFIEQIKLAFSNKSYLTCVSLIEEIDCCDDELAYILACSYFELGVSAAKLGSFITAEKHLANSRKYCDLTIYDTGSIECKIPLYESFVKNVNAPLLDFDNARFALDMAKIVDYEFYKYICNDAEYSYTNKLFERHLFARAKIKERKYYEAINILLEIADSKSSFEYNAYFMYSVYGDLDNCYKQICDFENAYKYSGKRISMLEGFNS